MTVHSFWQEFLNFSYNVDSPQTILFSRSTLLGFSKGPEVNHG